MEITAMDFVNAYIANSSRVAAFFIMSFIVVCLCQAGIYIAAKSKNFLTVSLLFIANMIHLFALGIAWYMHVEFLDVGIFAMPTIDTLVAICCEGAGIITFAGILCVVYYAVKYRKK